MRSYPVKEQQISSAVSEILWYTHTNILLLYCKDNTFNAKILLQTASTSAVDTFSPFHLNIQSGNNKEIKEEL